jgi:glucose/arabinose dehydrogenase
LGYSGIARSFAIEFDTYLSSGDINNNHVSMWRDGNMSNSLLTRASAIDFNSGATVYVWVDYNGERDSLSMYLASTNTKPAAAFATIQIDLPSIIGNQAYFGFTAATGTVYNAHRILGWNLNLNRPTGSTPVTPPDLIQETIVSGLLQPTAAQFSADGRNLYIAEKDGLVRVMRDGVMQTAPFIDIRNQVNNASDRGLLDIALHPNFAANPYIYLLFTYDPPEVYQNSGLAGPDQVGNRAGRLTRVTADAVTNYTTAVPGSQVILLGSNSTWNNFNGSIDSTNDLLAPPAGLNPDGSYIRDFIASDSQSHSVGSLAFSTDGSLFVSIGDGASYNSVDPRATRVQDLDSLSGKILRIDPLTGQGLPSNPFYNNDPNSNRAKVYQSGLRNPFRISVNPQTGRLIVGDVGWTQWEEINSASAGANFGWPYYEGGSGTNLQTNGYRDLAKARAFYSSGAVSTPAAFALNHSADGINAIALGASYTGSTYPAQYRNSIFFNDLGQGIVRSGIVDSNGRISSVETFATGARYVVQIFQGSDGNLYFVQPMAARRETATISSPVPSATATNLLAEATSTHFALAASVIPTASTRIPTATTRKVSMVTPSPKFPAPTALTQIATRSNQVVNSKTAKLAPSSAEIRASLVDLLAKNKLRVNLERSMPRVHPVSR